MSELGLAHDALSRARQEAIARLGNVLRRVLL